MASVPSAVVIGGGISGLSCAHHLLELIKRNGKNFEVVLLEAGLRLGGIIATEEHEGFLLEKGPDAFLREKPAALELARRLGLENEVIETRRYGRRSFIMRGGKLHPVPEGFYLIGPSRILPFLRAPIFSWAGKLRILSEAFVPKRSQGGDESVASFVRRRFGRECLERAGQPMLAGIYTGDPDYLSLSATLPRFIELEKKYGSVIRGLRNENYKKASGPRYGLFASFKNGMQTLTDALARTLPSGTVHLNAPVQKISRGNAKDRWNVETSQGRVFETDAVCVSLPAAHAKKILPDECRGISEKLAKLNFESVAIVNLAYRGRALNRVPEGFGFVVPSSEKKAILACSFVEQKFEHRVPEGGKLFRVFVGGAFGHETLQKSDGEIQGLIQEELHEWMGIGERAQFSRLHRYPSSMVQYGLGHLDWLQDLQNSLQKFPGLHLAGASYGGVGIPDCVRSGEEEAEKIFTTLCEKEKRST